MHEKNQLLVIRISKKLLLEIGYFLNSIGHHLTFYLLDVVINNVPKT
jgi:hypothetical protein